MYGNITSALLVITSALRSYLKRAPISGDMALALVLIWVSTSSLRSSILEIGPIQYYCNSHAVTPGSFFEIGQSFLDFPNYFYFPH